MSCARLDSNTKSQNKLDGSEQPEREDQQISGRLKSPTRIRNFSLAARVCRKQSGV